MCTTGNIVFTSHARLDYSLLNDFTGSINAALID